MSWGLNMTGHRDAVIAKVKAGPSWGGDDSQLAPTLAYLADELSKYPAGSAVQLSAGGHSDSVGNRSLNITIGAAVLTLDEPKAPAVPGLLAAVHTAAASPTTWRMYLTEKAAAWIAHIEKGLAESDFSGTPPTIEAQAALTATRIYLKSTQTSVMHTGGLILNPFALDGGANNRRAFFDWCKENGVLEYLVPNVFFSAAELVTFIAPEKWSELAALSSAYILEAYAYGITAGVGPLDWLESLLIEQKKAGGRDGLLVRWERSQDTVQGPGITGQ